MLSKFLHHRQHHPPRRLRVLSGVMVVELEADVFGHRAQLVVGQLWPSFSCGLAGAAALKRRAFYIEMSQCAAQLSQVKRGIMGNNEIGLGEQGEEVGSDDGELRLVLHVEPSQAVAVGELRQEEAGTFRGTYQPVPRFHQAAVLKDRRPRGTDARVAVVGGFKIQSDKFRGSSW